MKRAIFLVVFLAVRIALAQLPPVVPIVTAEELHLAVADVPVAKIDFMIPAKPVDAEALIIKKFFNQPAERRYAGLTSEHWKEKWQLFSDSLVAKATQAGLDAKSLEQALNSLNKGRNLQTALWPFAPTEVDGFGISDKQEKEQNTQRKKAQESYKQRLKEREQNPEPYFDNHLAVVPVGAYLSKHANGECWLIVCKWEHTDEQRFMSLGHIMIWAIDTKTKAVIAYVTCD